MIAKELPDELLEFFRKLCTLYLIKRLIECLPVPFFIVFINVLIQWVTFYCLINKWHHPRNHNEQNDPNCKYIGRVSLVRLPFMNLRSHVPFRAHMRVINSDHAPLCERLCKSEVADLEVKMSVNQDILKFEVTMNNS